MSVVKLCIWLIGPGMVADACRQGAAPYCVSVEQVNGRTVVLKLQRTAKQNKIEVKVSALRDGRVNGAEA